jgi:hypothetical protein
MTALAELGNEIDRFGIAEDAVVGLQDLLYDGERLVDVVLVADERAKDSYYRAQFFRLQARRGPQKAICGVAASLLTAIYHILKQGTEHHDLGSAYFDRRPVEAKGSHFVARLKKLGFTVQLQPIAEAA